VPDARNSIEQDVITAKDALDATRLCRHGRRADEHRRQNAGGQQTHQRVPDRSVVR
jgi:hypothetical protein